MAKIKTARLRPARNLTTLLASTFLALSVVILLVSGGLQLLLNINIQQQAVSSQQQIIAQNAANTVSSFIEGKFSVLSTTVSLTLPNTLTSEEQTQLLRSLLASQPAFRQLAIFDTKNNQTAQASRIQLNSTTASEEFTSQVTGNVLTLARNKQRYISPVYFAHFTNEPLVLMAIPSVNAIGEFQGTMVAELNLISMWNLVGQLKVGETGYAYVVDSQGKLIAYRDTARALKGEDTSKIKSVNEFMLNPTTTSVKGTSLYTGITNTFVVGTYAPLGTPNWAVVTEMPWQEAYRNSIGIAAASVAIIVIMAILASVVGISLARRLAIPLIELTGTATAVAAGDFKRRAELKGGFETEALARAFNNMTDQLQGLITGLEERVEERTRVLERHSLELQTAAQIARDASLAQDVDSMLDRTARLIREKFGYYHVGIFMVDDNEEYAVLVAAGGEAGQIMLATKHKLRVGETGIVGYVAQTGEPRIALDVGADAAHFQNPLLPYTRSEMTLPLKIENRIIGILDVQSDRINAFDQNSITIMQILTDQLSVAIGRIRLLQELQQGTTALEQTLQKNTSRAWQTFFHQNSKQIGYRYDGVKIESTSGLSQDILIAIQKNEPVAITKDATGSSLKVLIRLRGQTLGILNLRFQIQEIPQETVRLVEEAANRLALALENARLVQDTQLRAEREQTLSQITGRIRETLDIDVVLQTAVREIKQSFNLDQAEVRLQLTEQSPKPVDRGDHE